MLSAALGLKKLTITPCCAGCLWFHTESVALVTRSWKSLETW